MRKRLHDYLFTPCFTNWIGSRHRFAYLKIFSGMQILPRIAYQNLNYNLHENVKVE